LASRIEQYALIGDTQTVALVDQGGSIDWFCAPRFDSSACFAALLGTEEHGSWRIAPVGEYRSTRRYRDGTLVLETDVETTDPGTAGSGNAGSVTGGTARIIDCMPVRDEHVDIVRVVRGISGCVRMRLEIRIRFDYGSIVPWVEQRAGRLLAIGGPDALVLHAPFRLEPHGLSHVVEFDVAAGDELTFTLQWFPSHHRPPQAADGARAVAETTAWWQAWSARSTYQRGWPELVNRSAITLKALTYAPTGGIVAAATTSLPEWIGSVRNWDYRYCWLRDATFSLYALMTLGYLDEARDWRDWLVRAIAGSPQQLQIMYGPAGERRLTETELSWLPGYERSAPVRIGNAACDQFQLDVYGEVADVVHAAQSHGLEPDRRIFGIQRAMLDFLQEGWHEPDEGIWEVRGPRRQFTHSNVMAWVAFDRAVQAVDRGNLDYDRARLVALRDQVRDDVLAHGFDADRNAFVQSYGSSALDASVLMLPLVGFIAPDDPRMLGTVEAIERELMEDGLVLRYQADESIDGLPPGEGVFLPCSFWLADNLALTGRTAEARELFERLVGLANDVGLLSEEYDPVSGRLLGNFPQAMTHVALINTACNLSDTRGPARSRADAGRGR